MNAHLATGSTRSIQRRVWRVAALLACLPLGAQAQTVTYEKTEQIVYENNKTAWVIGQVKSVTCAAAIPTSTACNGDVVAETSYDAATALPLQSKAFGKIQQTLTYNLTAGTQDGTLATVKDGNNNITTLSGWKRGVPGKVTYPATTDQPTAVFQQAAINDDGTIASITDENGFVTKYQYDAMGRLSLIDYPDGDTVAWTSTTRNFAFKPGIYGLPSHWRLWEYTGSGYKVTRYDALWRPVVEETYVNGDSTSYSIVVKRYDANGRLAFQSYPLASLTNYTDTTLKGTDYTYDALDRPLTAVQDSELGLLTTRTEYLTGFQTRVTSPRLYQTVIQYQAYDQPSTDAPVGITRYAGVDTSATEITRDPFGKPTWLTRRNADSSTWERKYFYYNAFQELCKSKEVQTGITAMGYDTAGNLAWSASGLPWSSDTTCEYTASTAAARRIDRTYDARNRLKTLSFPGSNGNQTWTYAPDGLPASVVANNVGGQQATTLYTYNRRRLLEAERLSYGSVFSWPVDYVYNTNGHLSAQVWHGLSVGYAPDALGRPTQAGTFATGVSYYPNGAIKQFTYGNGIVHTMTQNLRQLPDTSKDAYGTTAYLSDSYDYDANGNVAAITDGATGRNQRGNRTMTYDALDRLTKVVSPMYGTQGATFTYDVLDNLTRTYIGGAAARNHYYCYNTKQQLAFVRTGSVCTGTTPSPAVTALEYDVQGNLSDKNSQTFAFDFGNRLRTSSVGNSRYAYDGLGRRVWDATTASKYSHYLQNGQLSLTSDARVGEVAEYIYLQGSLIATRERNTTTNVYTTKYQHTDALGSPVAMTGAGRTVAARYEYEPYGKGGPADVPSYTGHVLDGATGLVQMQQRYYDPVIGRFLSVDPVTADANTGGNFNRYWYANNNPYKFVDPDGRVPIVTRMKNGSVLIQYPTKFTGPAASAENIKAAKEHVAAMSGTYSVNGVETEVTVEVTEINDKFFGGTPRAARNEIKLVEGPTSHPSGRSFAEVGGNYGEIDVADRFTVNGVTPHEFGHLGGLHDLGDPKTGLPDPAKGNGIMNRVPGVVDSATVEGIINAKSSIQREEN